MNKYVHVLLAMIMISHFNSAAYALSKNGEGPERDQAVALYLFNEGAGSTVNDRTANPLNLTIAGSTSWVADGLQVIDSTGIRSSSAATKIINACNTSNEMTIEAWVTPQRNDSVLLPLYGPARIASLSKGTQTRGGFYLGQGYDAGNFYRFALNTTTGLDAKKSLQVETPDAKNTGLRTMPDSTGTSVFRLNKPVHIIAIKDSKNVMSLYVSDEFNVPILRVRQTINQKIQFDNDFVLTLANDALGGDKSSTIIPGTDTIRLEHKPFAGVYHMVAVYCSALSDREVLGSLAPTPWRTQEISGNFVKSSGDITAARQLAYQMYKRITGLAVSIDHPTLVQMESALGSDPSNMNNRLAAAAIATQQPGFYNRTVKDFAKRMSNRLHKVDVPLNDLTASFIGVTRDNIDARELLRGDFYYRANPDKAAVPQNLVNDFALSNNHYQALESMDYDLSAVLEKVNGQFFYKGSGNNIVYATNSSGVLAYDAAGVLTSRAFLSEHAIAGTNRRLIEFSFSEFLCREMTQWANNSAPDNMVGRDVDRFPTGDANKYKTSCRACHAQMDALRPAFSRITFETGFTKHAWIVGEKPMGNQSPLAYANDANNNTDVATMVQLPRGVTGKMNKNFDVFDTGAEVQDNKWINYASTGANATYFGWKEGTTSGTGIRAFGNMIAESRAFSTCMTKRVFRSVCKRDPEVIDDNMINRVAESFRGGDGYKMRRLFERIAAQPECLGQ